MRGEVIPSQDFATQPGGLRLFGEIVWEDHHKDEAIAQYTLDGEILYQKVHPTEILTPEQQHLKRPSDTREGRRQSEIEALDNAMAQQRIGDIRAELSKI